MNLTLVNAVGGLIGALISVVFMLGIFSAKSESEYLLLDGSRAMKGRLNIGGRDIVGVGTLSTSRTYAQNVKNISLVGSSSDTFVLLNASQVLSNKTFSGFSVSGHIIPTVNLAYDFGNSTLNFRSIYVTQDVQFEGGLGLRSPTSNTLIAYNSGFQARPDGSISFWDDLFSPSFHFNAGGAGVLLTIRRRSDDAIMLGIACGSQANGASCVYMDQEGETSIYYLTGLIGGALSGRQVFLDSAGSGGSGYRRLRVPN